MIGTRSLAVLLLTCLVLSGGCRQNRAYVGRTPTPPPGRPRTIPPTAIPDLPPAPAPEFGVRGGEGPKYTPPRAELLLPEPIPPAKPESKYPALEPIESRVTPPSVKSSPIKPDAVVQSPSRLPELPQSKSATTRIPDVKTDPVSPDPFWKNDNVTDNTLKPIGIEEFTRLGDGLYISRRPDIEGLDWLQKSKFTSVMYLRQSNDDDSSDQRQAEKRGLQYSSHIIAADTINLAIIKEISSTIGDSKQRPMLIYDRDRSLVGVVWYLHLRTVDGLTHSEASLKARSMGFNPDGTANQKALAVAAKGLFTE